MNKLILAGIVSLAGTAATVSTASDPLKVEPLDLLAQAATPQPGSGPKVPPTAKQDSVKDSVFKMPAQPVLNGAKSRSELDEIIRKALK